MRPESPASRYAAHQALQSVGPEGQARIRKSSVVLIGLGGLGCAAAQYLTGSGVDRLTLCDFDNVAHSNLARQVLYTPGDIGRPKAEVAAERLARFNPDVQIETERQRVDPERAADLLARHDLAIDASDNYGTRLAVNQASLSTQTPWVMGSCVRLEGQFVFFSGQAGEACYRCVYGAAPDTLEDCPGAGIFAPVAGVIGSAMAHAALLHLAGAAVPRSLQLLDATSWAWRSLAVRPRPHCAGCGGQQSAQGFTR